MMASKAIPITILISLLITLINKNIPIITRKIIGHSIIIPPIFTNIFKTFITKIRLQ